MPFPPKTDRSASLPLAADRPLEPNKYFTNLTLAAPYCETGRYADALPLFEQGLSQFENSAKRSESKEQGFSP
jgi:hypothetical protein